MSDKLALWINEQLEKNGWTIREFSRRIGISHTHASRIVNAEVTPSAEICSHIARAFGADPSTVFVYAGLLKPRPEPTPGLRELNFLYEQLDPQSQENILKMMRGYVREVQAGYAKKD